MIATGFFGRIGNAVSRTHVVDGRNRPICGYKPKRGMHFRRVAEGYVLSYVHCDECREQVKRALKVRGKWA